MNEIRPANAAWQQALNRISAEIEKVTHTLTQTPDNHPDMPLLLIRMGSSYDDRFDLVGNSSDIDMAIGYTNMALTLTPEHHPTLPSLLGLLGSYHGKRFQRLQEVHDSDQSIEYTSLAIAITPNGQPALPVMHASLGAFYDERFQSLGKLDDLEKALEHKACAVDSTPNGDLSLPGRLANLGLSYSNRFERLGGQADIEKAIECQSRAVALTPEGHPDLSNRLATLAVSHTNRFEHLGELNDLEKAIECEFRALTLTPDGHPHLPARLSNLGISLITRFERLGQVSDLEKAIGYESRAVALTPEGHPDLANHLATLAVSHKNRFGTLGELNDLEKAIEYEFRALTLTPDGHPHLPARLNNLGVSLRTRFERLGQVSDLKKAIGYEARAVALTPNGHPHLPSRLVNLANSLTTRFHRLRELDDLNKAIECESRALALTPESHPDVSIYLHNLSSSYSDRYQHSRKLEDINKAIEYETRALALTPNDHPLLVTRLHGLGVDHSRRFHHLHEREDIDKVIEYMTYALELTSNADPLFPTMHFPLALFGYYQYLFTGDRSHLRESLVSFRMSSKSLAGSPREKFRFALGWARNALTEPSLCVLEAYQTTIDLLPQFVGLGSTTNQRYEDLSTAETLAIDAAAAAIKSSDYSLALEWLDHARCVVWNQSLMLRSPLDGLHSSHPELASRLHNVATSLHSASSDPSQSRALSSSSHDPEHVARQHRQLAQEYDRLLGQARSLDGFEDLLQPMKAIKLVRAARSGPVVVINCHKDRCDALIIMPGRDDIQHIPLPDFSAAKARTTRLGMEKSVRHGRQMERGVERRPVLEEIIELENVLYTIWYDVVKPVLNFLGYTSVPNDNLPHITWCPTGALSFLPLHAAGDYSRPQSRVFDYVISSYTPTLTALLSSTPSTLSSDSKVLAIGQSDTPGHSPLPGTADELEYVKTHMWERVVYSQLGDNQATTAAALDAMKHHDWVHLACHAHQNVSDPTQSGFFLHDGTLDLASINQQLFQNKGLAYLSACQTATGDEKLPDEAIHLASGMLMAGYSSVIATMWSVMDDDAPFVADKFYAQLMRNGTLGNGEAGKALHHAVGELREKIGVREFRRWVPYIHIGS